VLVNLLSNAAKYGQKASPIEVRVEAGPSDVEVAVSNRGPGIPPDELPALFSPFFRARGARAGKTPGIGLGLYLVKGLVEAHGGRIWAESVPDEETTFRLALPLPTSREDPVAAIEGESSGVCLRRASSGRGDKRSRGAVRASSNR
jgi:signal transduction histidine kinase